MTLSLQTKNTTVFTRPFRSDFHQWDDAVVSWDEPLIAWDEGLTVFVNSSKNITSFANQSKS